MKHARKLLLSVLLNAFIGASYAYNPIVYVGDRPLHVGTLVDQNFHNHENKTLCFKASPSLFILDDAYSRSHLVYINNFTGSLRVGNFDFIMRMPILSVGNRAGLSGGRSISIFDHGVGDLTAEANYYFLRNDIHRFSVGLIGSFPLGRSNLGQPESRLGIGIKSDYTNFSWEKDNRKLTFNINAQVLAFLKDGKGSCPCCFFDNVKTRVDLTESLTYNHSNGMFATIGLSQHYFCEQQTNHLIPHIAFVRRNGLGGSEKDVQEITVGLKSRTASRIENDFIFKSFIELGYEYGYMTAYSKHSPFISFGVEAVKLRDNSIRPTVSAKSGFRF